MDLIDHFGGNPANFLDVGGGATPEKVAAGFRLLLTDENVQAILVNIFGGLTYCDDVADGILTALQERQTRVPIVVRMEGTHAGEARRKLEAAQLVMADTLIDAVQKSIAFSNGGWNGYLD